jgi:hypothetical protein
VQFETAGKLGGAELFGRGGQRVEDGKRTIEHLDAISGA